MYLVEWIVFTMSKEVSPPKNAGTSSSLVDMLLNGENYLSLTSLSQSETFWLRNRAKFRYVNDTIEAPSPYDLAYAKWEIDNF